MFAALQTEFARAVRDPAHAVPADISACHGMSSVQRFNIYRNNVAVGLIDALAARFPVTQQIVGEAFFKTMARVFIADYPPRSPLMMFYGDEFPDFIAAFPPAQEIVYLQDIARLEAAVTRAYHAEDTRPLDASVLQTLNPEELAALRVTLHPAVEIIQSSHPIVTIFVMHTGDKPLAEITDWHGEAALVSRPELDVDIRCLPPGGACFLLALGEGLSLSEAVEFAVADDPAFDLALNLAGLFRVGLV